MLDLSLFASLAAKAGGACNTCNPSRPEACYRVNDNDINAVTHVTPVTPQNSVTERVDDTRIAEYIARAHRGAAAYAEWLALSDVEGYGEAEAG